MFVSAAIWVDAHEETPWQNFGAYGCCESKNACEPYRPARAVSLLPARRTLQLCVCGHGLKHRRVERQLTSLLLLLLLLLKLLLGRRLAENITHRVVFIVKYEIFYLNLNESRYGDVCQKRQQ